MMDMSIILTIHETKQGPMVFVSLKFSVDKENNSGIQVFKTVRPK